jgi:hypothetical protein
LKAICAVSLVANSHDLPAVGAQLLFYLLELAYLGFDIRNDRVAAAPEEEFAVVIAARDKLGAK